MSLAVLALILALLQVRQKSEIRHLAREVTEGRNEVQQARQAEMILRNLALRIATDARREPALEKILKDHRLNVTLDTEAGKRPTQGKR